MNNDVYESNCDNCGEDLYSYTHFKYFCNDWCRYEHHNAIQRRKADEKRKKEEEEKKQKKQKKDKK